MRISTLQTYIFRHILGAVSLFLLIQIPTVNAHHSYAMFDNGRVVTVTGTVAKLEWDNPHIFLWAYVADDSTESGYELYAFETGSITMMSKAGWSREDTVEIGEEVEILYFPLFDGRPGGSLATLTHADGSVTPGDFPALRYLDAIPESERGGN